MQTRTILRIGGFLNLFVVCLGLGLIVAFGPKSAYINIGWSDKLTIASVVIDTWVKYTIALAVFGIMSFVGVLVDSTALAIVYFKLFDNTKTVTDLTRVELCIFACLLFATTQMRLVLMMMAGISQVDIALVCVGCSFFAYFIMAIVVTGRKEFKSTDRMKEDEKMFELIDDDNGTPNQIPLYDTPEELVFANIAINVKRRKKETSPPIVVNEPVEVND